MVYCLRHPNPPYALSFFCKRRRQPKFYNDGIPRFRHYIHAAVVSCMHFRLHFSTCCKVSKLCCEMLMEKLKRYFLQAFFLIFKRDMECFYILVWLYLKVWPRMALEGHLVVGRWHDIIHCTSALAFIHHYHCSNTTLPSWWNFAKSILINT